MHEWVVKKDLSILGAIFTCSEKTTQKDLKWKFKVDGVLRHKIS